MAGPMRRPALARKQVRALMLATASFSGLWLLQSVPTFIPGHVPGLRSAEGLRAGSARTVRYGEMQPDEDDGGFMKFLKVENDIELSPEEFALALDQEIEAQRKRYYIRGEVKPNNLVVPWKPIDEKQLEADARRVLKKNGILDPAAGQEKKKEKEDTPCSVQLIGEQDVRVEWTAGEPGQKVGYLIEKKSPRDSNFREVATYENEGTRFLLVQGYAGHEYSYTDQMVKSGSYTYRVLSRNRDGQISVIDQKDITVPELTGVDQTTSIIGILLFFFLTACWGFYADPSAKFG